MIKYFARAAVLISASWLSLPASGDADQAADEAAIRKNIDSYVSAYNRRDAHTLASFWSAEAVYHNPVAGDEVSGRDAIAEQFSAIFAEFPDSELEVHVDSIDFVSPNVAVEHGTAVITSPHETPETTHFSAVHVKHDGKWLLDRVSESDPVLEPASNYEHLKELEWMIGSWADVDENATVHTDCQWAKNRNFMTRSFAVVVGDAIDMAGMQVVGWDPTAKQIRSWVFDSSGGFGEATWTRDGNRWFIHAVGTNPDGSKSSAVNILKYVDENSCTWQSINRESDGEMLPNVEEVQLNRVESPE